jgi:hypothetical protein
MQQCHKDLRTKRVITSGKQENNQTSCRSADLRAGCLKANSWDFHYTSENVCQDIVEGSAPSETKEETTSDRLRVMDEG